MTLDHIVRQVVDGTQIRTRGRGGPLRDDAAVELRPLHGVIMRVHVGAAFVAGRIKRHLPTAQRIRSRIE